MSEEKNYRVFDPRGLSPSEYTTKYPELLDIKEFREADLRGIELIWIWYYSNHESPYVEKYPDHRDRCLHVTDLCYNQIMKNAFYDEKFVLRLRAGNIPDSWNPAIDRMRRIDTAARVRAKSIIDSIFDQYEGIINGGVEQFQKDGITDFREYASTMKLIRNELKEIINEQEAGFGVSEMLRKDSDDVSEGDYWCNVFLQSK